MSGGHGRAREKKTSEYKSLYQRQIKFCFFFLSMIVQIDDKVKRNFSWPTFRYYVGTDAKFSVQQRHRGKKNCLHPMISVCTITIFFFGCNLLFIKYVLFSKRRYFIETLGNIVFIFANAVTQVYRKIVSITLAWYCAVCM